MRSSVLSIRPHLSRVALAALMAGLAAGRSSDTSRFASSNPFSNPFDGAPQQTATVSPSAYPAPPVQSQPLPAAGTVPSVRPIAAQPLPPIGSVGSRPASPSPVVMNEPRSTLVTGSVAAPRVSGFSKGGWSAVGGSIVAAQAGDTVQSISNRYGVPVDAIVAVNGLSGTALAPGQQITIPVYSAHAAQQAAPRPATVAAAPQPLPLRQAAPAPVPARQLARLEPEPTPKPRAAAPLPPRQTALAEAPAGGVHVVKPGETLTSIAQSYGTTRPRLAKANDIDEWMNVRIGQKLRVPGAAVAAAQPQAPAAAKPTVKPVRVATVKAAPVAQDDDDVAEAAPAKPVVVAQAKPAKRKVEVADPDDGDEATASLPAKPAKPVAAADEEATVAKVAAPAMPQFRWPVRGRVIQSFGQNSDGINISVPEGTEVKAAESGVVAYAGSELKGYGNLVLIRHADGYVTAYAHAEKLNVRRGEEVKRGQVIATAGQTGNVTSPQLLFELRRGATPVDPRQYLSGT